MRSWFGSDAHVTSRKRWLGTQKWQWLMSIGRHFLYKFLINYHLMQLNKPGNNWRGECTVLEKIEALPCPESPESIHYWRIHSNSRTQYTIETDNHKSYNHASRLIRKLMQNWLLSSYKMGFTNKYENVWLQIVTVLCKLWNVKCFRTSLLV